MMHTMSWRLLPMPILGERDGGPAEFLLILGVIILGIAGVVLAQWADAKRRRELAEFARANGFEFLAKPPFERFAAYRPLQPFDAGHSRSAANLLYGPRNGIDWELFDYRYVTGSGKSRQTYHVGVAAAKVGLAFPAMQIRPEGLFDKLAAAVGFDDIDFESEEFSRRYYVKSANRKLAYDLLHPQMLEYLLGLPKLHWQFSGPRVLICKTGRYGVADLPGIMTAIEGFLARVPEFVRQDIGAPARQTA